MKTFTQFLATRTQHADIATAYGSDWESMMLPSPVYPGWLYEGEEGQTYFMTARPGQNRRGDDVTFYGCPFENNEIHAEALESAEAQLYSNVYHDAEESLQFDAIRYAFPDYDDILPVLPGMVESSWKNDTSPKFTLDIGRYEAVLWCDYRTQALREYNEEASPQFCLTIGDDSGDYESVQASTGYDAIPEELTHHILTQIMIHWCAAEGLLHESADEMILRDDLTPEQRQFITDVINAWEAAE